MSCFILGATIFEAQRDFRRSMSCTQDLRNSRVFWDEKLVSKSG